MIDLSRASAPDDGVARRTILAGAAWSIPVIATATVAPAASASGTLALAFNQASYTGTACSTITGAYVTATNGGVPAAGVAVTVSIANNYVFAGGSTSYTATSDGSGRVALPSISVPTIGGTGSLQAASGAETATSTTTAKPALQTISYDTYSGLTGLPSNIVITDIATCSNGSGGHIVNVLTDDGTIYYSTNGATFQTGSSTATHIAGADGAIAVAYSNNQVSYFTYSVGGIPTTATITDVATCSNGSGGHYAIVRCSDGTAYVSTNGSALTVAKTNVTRLAAADAAIVYAISKSCS